jgi:hypothetical protein
MPRVFLRNGRLVGPSLRSCLLLSLDGSAHSRGGPGSLAPTHDPDGELLVSASNARAQPAPLDHFADERHGQPVV